MPFQDDAPRASSSRSKVGERRVALVIGNAVYAYPKALASPANDARAIACVLERLGFEVIRGLDLDLDAMRDTKAAFEARLRTQPNVALVFYAGGAIQVYSENYLVPVAPAIKEIAHFATHALPLGDLLGSMTERADVSLVFLDASRLSTLAGGLANTELHRVRARADLFIAYATSPGRGAWGGTGPNSSFTAALLKHIETPGLSIDDMMINVRRTVLSETDGRQQPWIQSSLRSRFYFVQAVHENTAVQKRDGSAQA